MNTYITDAHDRRIQGLILKVINHTPQLRHDEEKAVKKAIEQQLYGVFCKYSSGKS